MQSENRSRERRRRERKKFVGFSSQNVQSITQKGQLERDFLKHPIKTHSRTHAFACASQHNKKTGRASAEGASGKNCGISFPKYSKCKAKSALKREYFQSLALGRTHERMFLYAPRNAVGKLVTRAPKARAGKFVCFSSQNVQNITQKGQLERNFLKHPIVTHSRTHAFACASQHSKKTRRASAEGASGKKL